jgi:hypothetical protein
VLFINIFIFIFVKKQNTVYPKRCYQTIEPIHPSGHSTTVDTLVNYHHKGVIFESGHAFKVLLCEVVHFAYPYVPAGKIYFEV